MPGEVEDGCEVISERCSANEEDLLDGSSEKIESCDEDLSDGSANTKNVAQTLSSDDMLGALTLHVDSAVEENT